MHKGSSSHDPDTVRYIDAKTDRNGKREAARENTKLQTCLGAAFEQDSGEESM